MKVEVARKGYLGNMNNVIYTFEDGRKMTLLEMKKYRKTHIVVIV